MKSGELFDIQTLENDTTVQKKIWWGGYDDEGNYHRGAQSVGGWAETMEALEAELNHQKQVDEENRVTRAYAYLSNTPEPTLHDNLKQGRKRGFTLVALEPKPIES